MPLYALWVTLLLPGVWASMLAGVLYGTWLGSGLVFVGACLGAVVVFLLGRSVLRDWAQRRLEQLPKLQAGERAVSKEGLKLVLLTRLSPAFPYSLLNLAYGLSAVRLRDYSIGLIGILPGTVLFCGLGALAGDVGRFGEVLGGEADAGTWAMRLVGVLATLAVVWLVSRAARRALQDVETSLCSGLGRRQSRREAIRMNQARRTRLAGPVRCCSSANLARPQSVLIQRCRAGVDELMAAAGR